MSMVLISGAIMNSDDIKMTQEATREYANLSSYRLDEIRKDQLHDNRQQLGFNIFNIGIDLCGCKPIKMTERVI